MTGATCRCHVTTTPAEWCKPPDSATLRKRNGGDQCPDCRCAPHMPHADGCDCTAQITSDVINAAPSRTDNPFPQALYDLMDEAHIQCDPDIQGGREDGATPAYGEPARSAIGAGPVFGTSPIPLTQQLAWFDIFAERAADLLVERIVTRRPQLIAEARRRGIDGFREYGDSLCYKLEVLPDLDEELADGIWYGTEHLRRMP